MASCTDPPRWRYYLRRENGTVTPLIPMDELTSGVVLPEASSWMSLPGLKGMIEIRGAFAAGEGEKATKMNRVGGRTASPPRVGGVGVEAFDRSHLSDFISRLDVHEEESASTLSPVSPETPDHCSSAGEKSSDTQPTEHSTPPRTHSATAGDHGRGKHVCTHWVKTGTCAFVHRPQGCKYRHEMPDTMEGLRAIGWDAMRWPFWWQVKHPELFSPRASRRARHFQARARKNKPAGPNSDEPTGDTSAHPTTPSTHVPERVDSQETGREGTEDPSLDSQETSGERASTSTLSGTAVVPPVTSTLVDLMGDLTEGTDPLFPARQIWVDQFSYGGDQSDREEVDLIEP